jgi:formylglycine-generating enzyme required for sulfatase activity
MRRIVFLATAIVVASALPHPRTPAAEPSVSLEKQFRNSIGMQFALIPAGEFQMGSPQSETNWEDDESQHRVRITKPFYLGEYEVTQAEYEKVMGTNPSYFQNSESVTNNAVIGMDTRRFPVEEVRWDDAVEFCRKLSAIPAERREGRVYRLPTEAEWEYACRAGTTTPFHFGSELNGTEANCGGGISYGTTTQGLYLTQGPCPKRTTAVGSYAPNAFGLYDMHGNVWEWCHDWYDWDYYQGSPTDDPQGPPTASYRVIRGGGWNNFARFCRAAIRSGSAPSNQRSDLGFRVALNVSGQPQDGAMQSLPSKSISEPAVTPAGADPSKAEGTLGTSPQPKKQPANAADLPQSLSAPFDAAQAKEHQAAWAKQLGMPVGIENSCGMKLALIPPGEFQMGSPQSETKREDIESQHRVRITKPFYLGVHEVTVGQFRRFVEAKSYRTEAEQDGQGGYGFDESSNSWFQNAKYTWRNCGFAQGDDHPVVNVSWNDAKAFCDWLSAQEGKTYRLPTEAEWEYACRAGTNTVYSSGDDPETLARVGNVADATAKAKFHNRDLANKASDDYVYTAPVGRFQPNAFGLYDMHGNVWEWCQDWYDKDYYQGSPTDDPQGPPTASDRVRRGGSWYSDAGYCRAARRGSFAPSIRSDSMGFRVALVPPGT